MNTDVNIRPTYRISSHIYIYIFSACVISDMIKVRISVPTLLEITWYCASFCAAGLYEVNGAESEENFL